MRFNTVWGRLRIMSKKVTINDTNKDEMICVYCGERKFDFASRRDGIDECGMCGGNEWRKSSLPHDELPWRKRCP